MSMPDWEKKLLLDQLQNTMFYLKVKRDRVKALNHLAQILRSETPGHVEQVHVKGPRWWRTRQGYFEPQEEIVLTDDERREFRDWCEERAAKLKAEADETELAIAKGLAEG